MGVSHGPAGGYSWGVVQIAGKGCYREECIAKGCEEEDELGTGVEAGQVEVSVRYFGEPEVVSGSYALTLVEI